MSIKVALVIPTMDRGGAERQVALLAAGLRRQGHQPHVVLLTRKGPRTSELDAAEVPHTLVGKRGKLDPTAYFRLRKLLGELQPEVVHTFLFAANSYGRKAALSNGVPVVIGSERCVDLWKTWRHGVIDRYLAQRSAAITTNSQGVVDFYVGRGIPESLFHVIPNGIPERPSGPTPDRAQVARELGLDPAQRWIFAVGRLWPQKRYRDLIWAAELLNTLRGGDCALVIFGSGPQEGELLRYRDAVSDDSRIKLVGARPDVTELLTLADAFWIGSEYEGQSNALMEAMQAGCPCVASDIPGNRDLIEHEVSGLLVRLGDAADFARQTNFLWEHTERTAELVAEAQQRIATRFSVDAMVNSHARLYAALRARGTEV